MKVKDIIQHTQWIPNPKALKEKPQFSIWMPTFQRNKSGHLSRAIQSVLDQSFGDFELIIIDDASVDGSFAMIKQFMDADPRVHCLHHPQNVGLPALACYEAFLKSRADYFMFCFDDTEYSANALEKVHSYITQNRVKIAFGHIVWQNTTVAGEVEDFVLGKEFISQQNLSIHNFLPNLGVVIHRDVVDEIGFLDPHPAIARVTDWDYWKRAARSYELHRMNILVGYEYGLVTGNSLGLTYPLNSWLSYEWTEIERNDALKPGRYEEYDVKVVPSDLSYSSQLVLKDLFRFYSSKFWFSTEEIKMMDDISYGKILVLAPELSASISLPFENLIGCHFRFATINDDIKDIINAQAIVICRNLMSVSEKLVVELAKNLKIPLYYYLDDNFVILSRELEILSAYTEKKLKQILEDFSGVLTPNQRLADFFTEHGLHNNVYVFPPVKPSRNWFDHSSLPPKDEGTLRLGFMGGTHRNEHFSKFVLPAIIGIAKERNIELVIVGDAKVSDSDIPGVRIYRFPLDVSYHLTLGRMYASSIDILIHSGSDTANNTYKTPNVLLNAWVLGAIPVLANQPPYQMVEADGLGLLCDPEDADSWRKKLEIAINDVKLGQNIKNNLEKFVNAEYSGRQNLEVISSILSNTRPLGYATIDGRFRHYIDLLQKNSNFQTGIYSFSPIPALGIAQLWSKLKYKLKIEKPNWAGFQVVLGTFGKLITGTLKIEIRVPQMRMPIRTVEISMEKVVDNQAVLITFDLISDSEGKEYDVVFTHDLSSANNLIAIYETNRTEGKFKKFLRRLKLLSAGNNLAYNLIYADEDSKKNKT